MAYRYSLPDAEFARSDMSASLLGTITEAAVEAIQEDGRLVANIIMAYDKYGDGPTVCSLAAHLEVSGGGKTVRVVFDECLPDYAVDAINTLLAAAICDPGSPQNALPSLAVSYAPGSDWVAEYEVSTMQGDGGQIPWYGSMLDYFPPIDVAQWGVGRFPIEVIPLPYGMRPVGAEVAVDNLVVKRLVESYE